MCKQTKIVTPYKSNIKYYFTNGEIHFSKILPENLIFPYNTGVFEKTLSIRNNPLKNIIVFKHSLHPGTFIDSKIIGGFTYTDNNGLHQRIISVPCQIDVEDIQHVKSFVLDEIKFFFKSYNNLKKNKISFGNFINKEQSEDIYEDSKIRWNKLFIHTFRLDTVNNNITNNLDNSDNESVISNSSSSSNSMKRKFSNLFRKSKK